MTTERRRGICMLHSLLIVTKLCINAYLAADDNKMDFETSEDVEVNSTFDSMGLREDLLRGIFGFSKYYCCWAY